MKFWLKETFSSSNAINMRLNVGKFKSIRTAFLNDYHNAHGQLTVVSNSKHLLVVYDLYLMGYYELWSEPEHKNYVLVIR